MQTFAAILKIIDAADTLKNFASSTDNTVGKFGKKNLIYGYNGAGKTTISRIFSFIGSGERPAGLKAEFDFTIELDDGRKLTKGSDLGQFASRVLVYNEDYIERNFAWTRGTAEPIFGLGEQNITDVEALNAARNRHEQLMSELDNAKKTHRAAKTVFDNFCRDTARSIDQQVYDGRSFNAARLKARYEKDDLEGTDILGKAELAQARETLSQPAPAKLALCINPLPEQWRDLKGLFAVLVRTGQQVKLPELEAHRLMESWVKAGRAYHLDHKLGDCLFCGEVLTEGRLAQLAAHFSDEINQISIAATELKAQVEEAWRAVEAFEKESPKPEHIRVAKQAAYKALIYKRGTATDELIRLLKGFEGVLTRKLREPASAVADVNERAQMKTFSAAYGALRSVVQEQTRLVEDHNEFVDRFEEEREFARDALAKHLLAQDLVRYQQHSHTSTDAEDAASKVHAAIADIQKDIVVREAALREHASATQELNQAIEAFLRHSDISLHAVEEGYRLQRRDGTPVSRLSEGEKTAITFCYFITSIEADNRKLKDTIVVVDDPISSLDTRALTYMASLIRKRLDGAKQLFVFTHNAPFMSEMRKWIYSRTKMRKDREEEKKTGIKPDVPLYLLNLCFDVESKQRWATLESMGALLRDYEGEYHYLYSVVYHYARQPNPTSRLFLLLPNAIRKVMETYLLFKVPNNQNFSSAIDQIAKSVSNVPALHALRTFAELEGHGEDLSAITEPAVLTIEEAHPAAQELVALIEATDPTHAAEMKKLCERHPVE